MTGRKIIVLTLVVCVISMLILVTTACNKEEEKYTLINTDEISSLKDIQANGDLTFEWVKPYISTRPTLVVIPGEADDGYRFSMSLDENEYSLKEEAPSSYTVASTVIGWKEQGINRNLSWYWVNVAQYNVVIFHWENFANEENPDDIMSKLFSVAKMRYKSGEGYETSAVPQYSLTEILAALYIKEMDGKISNEEVRFVGNGVGANLALSLSHYLATGYKDGYVDAKFIPNRITLCDPYLSGSAIEASVKWANLDFSGGMIKLISAMLDTVNSVGTAGEMVESLEITDETSHYAYNFEKSEVMQVFYNEIKSKVAYLEFRESYSVKFTSIYKNYKRIALDWYLYSIIGSDDTDVGYPSAYSTYQSSTSTTRNWGDNDTRPILNNRKLNNNSSNGKNYAVGAWTPTVWIRALRGISFSMKSYSSTSSENDIHGNSIYTYKPYTMAFFRSENYQKSNQSGYTLICGYVYKDLNNNSYIDDGSIQGIANAKLTVKIVADGVDVNEFDIAADDTGFYCVKLDDKIKDDEGNLSTAGYSFAKTHTVTLTYVPNSNKYFNIATAVNPSATLLYYNTVSAHNFTKFVGTVSLTKSYADAITISNCLVRIVEAKK